MFSQLSRQLSTVFKTLSGDNTLSKKNMAPAIQAVKRALIEADVAIEVIQPFMKAIEQQALGSDVLGSLKPAEVFKKIVHDTLLETLTPSTTHTLNFSAKPPAVLMVCGLQGTGKTTSCAKLAHYIQHTMNKSVMLASTDLQRPGAIEQLNILGSQINIPCLDGTAYQTPYDIAEAALQEASKQAIEVLIIDTAGRLHIDATLMQEIKTLHTQLKPTETLFVLDSMMGQDAAHAAAAFKSQLTLTGTLLTKVDGESRAGAALSAQLITETPIQFMGTSEKIETGLRAFDPAYIAAQILDMGDIVGLVETVERTVNEATAKKMSQKIKKGSFSLEDFAQHMQHMQQMGGSQALLSKMPGFQAMQAQLTQAQPDAAIRKTLAIIQSMTRQEKQYPDLIKGRRKQRIARGSGTCIPDINQTLKQFKTMQKMMKRLKGGHLKRLMAQMTTQAPDRNFPK